MSGNALRSGTSRRAGAIGAFVGVPLGFLAGLALTQNRVCHALAVLPATLERNAVSDSSAA
ncbi:hypothetical protein ACVMAJ_001816 [Bradyrhizobium sp. USDA 4448]